MEKKINHIQTCILAGFAVFYGVSLAINAIESIFGGATLAVWHWGPFMLTAALVWGSIPAVRRCRIIIYARLTARRSAQLAKKVAFSMLGSVSRALRNLPALRLRRA